MSDTRGNEQDPLPASPGRRAKGTGAARGGGRDAAKGADTVGTDTGNAATARGRGPGRPAARAEVAGRIAARRIGIRELRQRASVFVDLAEKGYTVDITNRGRLVAQLVPVNEPGSPLERLIAAGIIEPAEEPGGAEGLEPYPPSGPGEPA
jgi:antitoxin (DNA-binding transcriptional repressor) of toxin-antitoxin stability system